MSSPLQTGMLDRVARTNWKTIGLFLLAFVLVFANVAGLFGLHVLTTLSGGLLNATLINAWVGILLVVGVVALWYGGLRPADLGFEPRKLPLGVGLTLLAWVVFTGAQAAYGLVVGSLAVHPSWSDPGVVATTGRTLGYWLGNAPFEELAFRGFLLVQLYLLFDRWSDDRRLRLVGAVAGSGLVFTLLHVPVVVLGGVDPLFLVNIFVYAVALSFVYLRTQNIFFTMGVHALANFPIPAFAVFEAHALAFQLVWIAVAAGVVVFWHRIPGAEPVARPADPGGPVRG
jgi:membrane protease YdiL (CAAX protease family)